MDLSVAYLAAVAVLAVVVVVLVVRARRRAATRPGERPARGRATEPSRGGPHGLSVGDRLRIREREYAVSGTIRLVEGDWSWVQHLLDDGSGTHHRLSVEGGGPDLELVLWTAEPGATVTPGAPTIDLGGRRYTWAETGQARYTAIGETGLPAAGTMRYHDYQSGGDARLSFEAYGEEGWLVARGDLLDPAELTIPPTAEER
ncbi:DUF4178 domain-containing protein [Micromonospora acroterricola]|uniref:DUF4178 domain-containing protein n=1 Tax=Micromonospora acroterricola TaxID=2202421 RepID=A0A317DCK7_9ACTN|nr:DUF4178 domain-containing protein [Micromonospora acroterricola]PWR12508.1 DUF4178 domain-containing protein [Micromonospora acroterricola]